MNILITICGRAGSKGVKNKNLKNFWGFPLVSYTIAAASLFRERNCQHDIDICINSDSQALMEIATKAGNVTAIERPIELAQDQSPKVPVINYSLNHMENLLNKKYDYVIDLDITSPLRKIEDIENALKKAVDRTEADVVFSVVHARRNPYFNMVENKDGIIRKIIQSDFVTRQQAPQVYDMNASIYCYKSDSLKNVLKRSPLEGNYDIVLMKDTAVLDIDSEEDFELMEILAGYFFKTDFKEIKDYVNELQ